MGRKSIVIEPIKDPRARESAFHNRVNGILKKALQLAIMCDCEVILEVKDHEGI